MTVTERLEDEVAHAHAILGLVLEANALDHSGACVDEELPDPDHCLACAVGLAYADTAPTR